MSQVFPVCHRPVEIVLPVLFPVTEISVLEVAASLPDAATGIDREVVDGDVGRLGQVPLEDLGDYLDANRLLSVRPGENKCAAQLYDAIENKISQVSTF